VSYTRIILLKKIQLDFLYNDVTSDVSYWWILQQFFLLRPKERRKASHGAGHHHPFHIIFFEEIFFSFNKENSFRLECLRIRNILPCLSIRFACVFQTQIQPRWIVGKNEAYIYAVVKHYFYKPFPSHFPVT